MSARLNQVKIPVADLQRSVSWGTVVRFIYLHPDRPLGFIGIDLPGDAGPTFYDTSRLGT